MNPSAWSTHRLLVPRWRPLAVTALSKELAVPGTSPIVRGGPSGEFVTRLERWRLGPGLVTAAEVVETALVEGREGEAVEAARRLVALEPTAAPLIRAQAATVLMRAGDGDEAPPELRPAPVSDASGWRAMTRLNPRDAVSWVELAFHQTVNGHVEAAIASMRVALQLAPDNRHVLRAASRLYLHKGDFGRAHDIVARSPATRDDPWLIAAEVALARVADRPSRYFKRGISIVDDGGLAPGQLTEVAGAVATVYLFDGNHKRSRRMFRTSVVDPTGNALAQAEWASRAFGVGLVSTEQLASGREAAEANAFHQYREQHFDKVPGLCEQWAQADPYSIRPFEFGSSAAAYVDDFETALRLADLGLRKRITAPVLLNHRAFALASLGRVEEAENTLRRLPREEGGWSSLIATANRGLCAFRRGSVDEGIGLYRTAVGGFERHGLIQLAAMASVYLAREACLAGHPGGAAFIREAEDRMSRFPGSEGGYVLRRLRANPKPGAAADPKGEPTEREKKLARLRSVTFSTPGAPGWDGKPRRLVI